MTVLKMVMALILTLFFLIKLCNDKKFIVPICLVFYLFNVINDIFNAGNPVALAFFGSIAYYPSDMFMVVLLGALIIGILREPFISKKFDNFLLILLVGITIVGLIRGITIFGFSSDIVGDFRTIYVFLISIIYCIRYFKIEYLVQYEKLIDRSMNLIASVTIALWILDLGFGIHPLMSQVVGTLSDGGSTMRFVQASEVFGLVLYTLYLIWKDIEVKRVVGFRSIFFLIIVILFQHRSIWLAMGLGLLAVCVCEIALNGISVKLFYEMVGVFVVSICFIVFSNSEIVESMKKSLDIFKLMLTGAKIEHSTAATRVSVWDAVLNDLSGISFWIGRPFGYGYGKSIGWDTSPHSGYVRLIARCGYLGFFTWGILIVKTFVKFITSKLPSCFIGMFVAMLAYMYGYDFTWLQGILLGVGIVMLREHYYYK